MPVLFLEPSPGLNWLAHVNSTTKSGVAARMTWCVAMLTKLNDAFEAAIFAL